MEKLTRPKLSERKLRDNLLSFAIDKEIKKLKKESFWLKGDRNSVTLQKNPNLRVVLTSLKKGAALKEHKVAGPITLFVLSGKLKFTVEKKEIKLKKNEMIVLEKAIQHDVEALEDTTFILTLITPKY